MLSFLKKNNDNSSAVTVPAWHPNFRNFERLPDAKAVRRLLLLNIIAISVVAVLAIYIGVREKKLIALRAETANALAVIQANKGASDQAVALYQKFVKEEKQVHELDAFLSVSKITVSDFILKIGADLPSAFIVSSIDYKPTAVTLRGSIEGASDEASGRAIAYVDALREDEEFSKLFGEILLSNIVRDPGTGNMRFEVNLEFKAPPKTAKPKGGKK